jgi:hypothetical protein
VRYVALLPNGLYDHFHPDAAKGLVGRHVPFRNPNGRLAAKAAEIVGARVDDEGLHLEFDLPVDAEVREVLSNLAIYGSPHGPDEVLPTRPEFSIGHSTGVAEVDPLLRVGCVRPSKVLDTHENRDALREIVRAAIKRFIEEGTDRG